MTRMHRLTACAIATLLAAGCSSISLKQGAGGADYKRDERACLGTTTERTAFLQCMEAKGWWTRSTEELATITLVSVEDADRARDEGSVSPTEADAPAQQQTPASAPAAATGTTPAAVAAAGPAPAAVARDPMSRVRIAMWSKMGAGTPDLIADQKRCLDTLGEAHAPDTTAGTVTRGLYECMRKQGWTGLTLR